MVCQVRRLDIFMKIHQNSMRKTNYASQDHTNYNQKTQDFFCQKYLQVFTVLVKQNYQFFLKYCPKTQEFIQNSREVWANLLRDIWFP